MNLDFDFVLLFSSSSAASPIWCLLYWHVVYLVFLSTTSCLNSSLTALYTWVINSYDLEQSSRDDTTPDAALRASLMSQPLFSPTAYKPFTYVSWNWIISVWVQPNVTWSQYYSLTAEYHLLRPSKTVAKLLQNWDFLKPSSDFYKQEPRFIVKTIVPKALLTSWNCVFYYRMQYYLINSSVRKHWENLLSQSDGSYTDTYKD